MRELTILAHGDSDGIASAALAKAALGEDYDRINVFFTHPVGLVEDFKSFSKGDVVIVDIAINESHLQELIKLFQEYEREITYIDHHPPPLSASINELGVKVINEDSEGASASELTFKHFMNKLDRDFDRVALFGCIGDYADQTEWVKKALARWDKRQIYFEAGILVQGLEGSRKLHDFKRHVVNHLSENRRPSMLSELVVRALIQAVNNEELHSWVEKEVKTMGEVAYVINPPGSLGIAATYSMGITGKPIGLAAELRGHQYVISVRAVKGVIDLNKALREITIALGGSGGGHSNAAGARVSKEALIPLIKRLNDRVMIIK